MADFPTLPSWRRGLRSKIATSTVVPPIGSILTDERGHLYGGANGTRQEKTLPYMASLQLGHVSITEPRFGGGADATGATDSTAAIQAALDFVEMERVAANRDHGRTVHIPYGQFKFSTTLLWGQSNIVADAQHGADLVWCGSTTATAMQSITRNSGGVATAAGLTQKKIQDVYFRSHNFAGVTKPACWLDASAGFADWGGELVRVGFGDISDATRAAVELGQAVNGHITNHVRFDVGRGYCMSIINAGGPGRSMALENFTAATQNGAGAGLFKGVLNVKCANASADVNVSIRNARIESANGDWATDSAIVDITETAPGNTGVRPVTVTMAAVNTQLNTQTQVAAVKQTTASTAVGSSVVLIGCTLPGLTDVVGGTWSPSVTIPRLPSGAQFLFFSLGRQNSSPTNKNIAQLPSLAIGDDDIRLDSDSTRSLVVTATSLKAPHAVTGSLPSAATAGKGGGGFDDSLNKPWWSTGAVRRYPIMTDEVVANGPPYKANAWVTPPVVTGASALTVGQPRFTRLILPRDCTVIAVAIEVTTAAAASSGGVVRLQLFADDGAGGPTGVPLVGSDFTTSTETTGVKTWTVSVALTAGPVHVAVVEQVAVSTLRACTGVSPWALLTGFGVNNSGLIGAGGVAGAFTSSPNISGGSGQAPFVGVQMQ